jgi:hypothetical protein
LGLVICLTNLCCDADAIFVDNSVKVWHLPFDIVKEGSLMLAGFVHPTRRCIFSCLIVFGIVAGCTASAATTGAKITPTPVKPTPSATAIPYLPAFSDWRAAYMGADGAMHVITLDGKTDIAGPQLPFTTDGSPLMIGFGITNAGIAPDGHTLAYASYGGLVTFDSAAHQPPSIENAAHTQPNEMEWSPDSRYLDLSDRGGGLWLDRVSDGTITTIPNTPFPSTPLPGGIFLDGWYDATHIVLARLDSAAPNAPEDVDIFDVITGTYSVLARFAIPPQQAVNADFLADHDSILLTYNTGPTSPLDPFVGLYHISSGTMTSLPNVAALQDSHYHFISNFVWKPGTHTLVLCTGSLLNGDLKDWLVNLTDDSVQPLSTIGYPMGWSPDSKSVVFSSGEGSYTGAGPYTLTALTFGPSGQMTQTVLTKSAMNFDFIGFVRTAT